MKTSTINLRVLGAASIFASKEETRYYLNGVCVEFEPRQATYIATDGHVLIVYRDTLTEKDTDNELIGKFIIPSAHCRPFKLGKEDTAIAKITGDEGKRLTIAHQFVDVTFNPIEGVYPEWRKIVPKDGSSGELAQFNADNVARFKKFAKALGLSDNPIVAHNGPNPALIWFGQHQPHALGLIMPYRSENMIGLAAPDWIGATGIPSKSEEEKEAA